MNIENININSIRTLIPQIIRNVFDEQGIPELEKEIQNNFNSGTAPIGKSNSNKLYNRTGNLLNSYKKGGKGNVYKLSISGSSIGIEFGSTLPYSKIHETGGTIKGSKRMASFFWAKFYETKSPYYKYLALRVQGGNDLTIPPRPVTTQAFQSFIKNTVPKILDIITNKIMDKL